MTIQIGDKVKFTDKWGVEQVGIYQGEKEVPGNDGPIMRSIVRGRPFADMGDDKEIDCIVRLDVLTKVN